MKLRSLLFVLFLGLTGNLFASNIHSNENAMREDQSLAAKETLYPGYCEIEIINDSLSDVYVSGAFDDGSTLGFNLYRFESPHYISLYYYGYCHSGMDITVQSPYGIIYSGWTYVNKTVRIVPYFSTIKAELTNK